MKTSLVDGISSESINLLHIIQDQLNQFPSVLDSGKSPPF